MVHISDIYLKKMNELVIETNDLLVIPDKTSGNFIVRGRINKDVRSLCPRVQKCLEGPQAQNLKLIGLKVSFNHYYRIEYKLPKC